MRKSIGILLIVFSTVFVASAQTTTFTYQGSLQNGGSPANGNYDLEFKLFDLVSGGTQQGSTLQRLNVPVANGVFAVSLDFGAGTLPGADRYLDIAVRTAGGGGFTPLSPRQKVNSAPYSVKSLNSTTADTANNALNLGGVAAGQYVLTGDPRMTDERNPLPNSANYIWNQNSVLQPSSNFVISGNGDVGGTLAANIVRAEMQYNIGGNRVLSVAGTQNTFVGIGAGAGGNSNSFFGNSAGAANMGGNGNSYFGWGAGQNNVLGFGNSFFGLAAGRDNTDINNSFFGYGAGSKNTTGRENAFFGKTAGTNNIDGSDNAFFGSDAGLENVAGYDNAFFGSDAGRENTAGVGNAFFGRFAGRQNTSGFENSFFGTEAGYASLATQNAFFGRRAGYATTTGDRNSFFGTLAGDTNTTGTYNTTVGYQADVLGNNLRNATAVGNRAAVGADHSLVLGSIAGINGCGDFGSFCESVNVGIGTTTPLSRLHIVGGADAGLTGAGYLVTGDVSALNVVIDNNEIMARSNGAASQLLLNADGGNVGVGTTSPLDTLHVDGVIRVATLGAAGATAVCRNASNQLSTCSSSLRYKTNIGQFSDGLLFVKRLRPISFDWKDGGMKDVGFGAEDVAKIDPRFVTYNDKGEVEGVKYDRMSVAFVNAFKEQQSQIEAQAKEIVEQRDINLRLQKQVDLLTKSICRTNPSDEVCKEEK